MQTMNAAELGTHATSVLMDRCGVEERAALRGLEDVADELRVRVADLAAVVVAASLMPSDWASRRDEGQPVISRGGDLHDPPPGNPLRMKPWASAC